MAQTKTLQPEISFYKLMIVISLNPMEWLYIFDQEREQVRSKKLLHTSFCQVLEGSDSEKRNLRTPDVSFVKAERLKKSKRDFVELVPDLMVEIKSKSDRIKTLEEKIQMFLQLGSTVGILIDTEQLTVKIYRLNQTPEVLKNGDTINLPDLLPGWELAVAELWPPEFD